MVKIKICGITNTHDALAAVDSGADALGFVFAPSPRRVEPATVKRLVAELPPLVTKIGVFANWSLDRVMITMKECGLDLAQLHGQETPAFCEALYPRAVKVMCLRDEVDVLSLPNYKACAYLLDRPKSFGGPTATYDWRWARKASRYGRIFLAGGLDPTNVGQAIALGDPYAVDVCSGVESKPGRKDQGKMKAFVAAAREASRDVQQVKLFADRAV